MAGAATSKTPRRPLSKTIPSEKFAQKKPLPNSSILNYFKKAANEDLFVGDGYAAPLEEIVGEKVDLFGADDSPERRYHEIETMVKRRRLNQSPEGSTAAYTSVERKTRVTKVSRSRKATNNPFLDDSSDDDKTESLECLPTTSATQNPEQPFLLRQESLNRHNGPADTAIEAKLEEPDNADSDELEGDMAAVGDEDEGEEYRMMRYMEQDEADADETGTEMAERCPLCNGSLAGTTADQATAHVNACLDGQPPADRAAEAGHPKAEADVDVAGPALGSWFGQPNPIRIDGAASGPPNKDAFSRLMAGHAEDQAWVAAAAAEHAARGKPARQRTCPFYKIMPGLAICVDAFRYGAVEGCSAYFLSHFHSDHYMGLTAHWTHGPIYCSKVTSSLVKTQLRTAARFVVELDFETTVDVPGTGGVKVTMIPANHCPGSSLFLFEKPGGGGRTRRILHCGDFRACPAHVHHALLRPETVDAVTGLTRQQSIDVCYLDTTYLNPRYSFPPQEDVVRVCADVCLALDKGLASGDESWWELLLRRREGGPPAALGGIDKFVTKDGLMEPDASKKPPRPPWPLKSVDALATLGRSRTERLLVVCGTYSIGKERMCKAIAQALKTKIFASPAKIRICKQLGDPEFAALLTSNPREAQVHMQMLMELRAETLADYLTEQRHNGFSRIVGFRPSGWTYRPTSSGSAGSGKNVVSANLPPASLPFAQLLHGSGWRTTFTAENHVAPQRGSSRHAMCFGVPYSEHSSFRELALFLMATRVERVVPTVNVGSEQSRKRMKGWIDRWLAARRRNGLVRVLERQQNGDEKEDRLWEASNEGRGGGVYW